MSTPTYAGADRGENVWRWQPSGFAWSQWCADIMATRTCERCFSSLQNSGWLKLSHALLLTLLSQSLYVRELCVWLPLRLWGILPFALHALHLCICGRDRGRWNVSGEHNCKESHMTTLKGVDPMNICIISLYSQVSQSAIFAVEKPLAKSVKIVLLKNLVPYGSLWQSNLSPPIWIIVLLHLTPNASPGHSNQQQSYSTKNKTCIF